MSTKKKVTNGHYQGEAHSKRGESSTGLVSIKISRKAYAVAQAKATELEKEIEKQTGVRSRVSASTAIEAILKESEA